MDKGFLQATGNQAAAAERARSSSMNSGTGLLAGSDDALSTQVPARTAEAQTSTADLAADVVDSTFGPPNSKRTSGRSSNYSETRCEPESLITGTVLDFETGMEVTRSIVCSERGVSLPRITAPNYWTFVKIFGSGDSLASGQVLMGPHATKSTKNTKASAYIYYMIEGKIAVRIHTSTYILSPGGTCMIPRGNNYSITNLTSQNARFLFCQAKSAADETSAHLDFFPSAFSSFGSPTSRAVIVGALLLERLSKRLRRFEKFATVWYEKELKPHMTQRRLCLIFFILGLMVRRLPFVGSPPLLNIQFVRVIT